MAVPVVGPALAAAAPFAGAAIGGAITSQVGQNLQDWLIKKLGWDKGTGFFSKAQEQADEAQHPDLTYASELAPSALSLGGAEGRVARGVGAAGMAGMEAARQYFGGEDFSPGKIAIAGGAGALLGGPREWAKNAGSKVAGPVTQALRAFRPGRPDTAAPDAAQDKAAANQANDLTSVAPVSQENSPVPQNPDTTGNPEGAPMQARVAAAPSDPARDFGKKPATASSVEGINTDAIHPDLASALGELNDNGQEPAPQSNSVVPPAGVPDPAAGGAGSPVGDVAGGVPAAPGRDTNPESLPLTNEQTGLGDAAQKFAQQQQDNHTPQVKAASTLSPLVDEVDASRAQRAQADAIKARQAAQQQGEDYPQDNTPRHPSLTAALEHMRTFPERAAMADEIDKWPNSKANPVGIEYMARLRSKTGNATGEKNRWGLPTVRDEAGGVQTGGGERAVRKAAAVKAVKDAFAKYGDQPAPTDRPGTVALAKQIVDTGKAGNNNVDPAGAYRVSKAHENYPQFKWYKAARAVVANPSAKNIQEFQAVHAAKGADASTNVDADIALKKTPTSDSLAEVVPDTSKPVHEQPAYEPLAPTQPGDDYVSKSNDLRDFVNKLSPDEWDALDQEYPLGLDHEITEGNNPGKLLEELQAARDQLNKPAARTPAGKVTEPVTDRFSETEPGAKASEGKSLKGTPEFEALAKQYGGAAPAKDESGLRANQNTLSSGVPVKGAVDYLWKQAKAVVGSAPATRKLLGYMLAPPKNPAAEKVGRDLSKQFAINEGAMENTDARLRANFAAGIGKLTPDEWRVLYRKLQTKTALTPVEQDTYDQFVKPLKKWDDRVYKVARKNDPTLPEPYSGGTTEHVPRTLVPDETAKRSSLPWEGRTLNDYSASQQERDFVALDDGAGNRLVFKNNDDGTGTVWKNTKPVKMKLPQGFEGKLGEKIDKYTVQPATTPEIMKNMPDLKYVENPLVDYGNSIRNNQASIIKHQMLKRLQTSPLIDQFSTFDKKQADDWGYKPTKLDGMDTVRGKTRYYDPRIAWRMDDFRQPGTNVDSFDWLRGAGQTMAKPLYFIAPGFHPMNVAANAFIGHAGLMARANPGKMLEIGRKFLPDLYDSYKSVVSQDKLQEEIRGAGGRTMYNTQLVDHGTIEDQMQKAGIHIAQRPDLWNRFAKSMGMGDKVQDLPHQLMNKSGRITWMANDVLLTSLYKTARRIGMDPNTAVDAVHNYVGNYRPDNPTMFGSRALQQTVNEPAFSWFGPYHQDLWHTMGHMYKGIVDPLAPGDRREALGALAGLGLLTYGVYPYILDPFAKWLTQNKDASFGRRGAAALAQLPADFAKGDPDAYSRLGENVFTPSIPINMAIEARQDLDWKGQHVLTPGAPVGTQVAEGVDWAARNAIPPYSTAAALARQQGVTVGSVLKKMAESTVGLKDPTPGSAKFQNNMTANDWKALKARTKKPEGFIERGVNALTR